jgi:hypothetical protein
MKDSICDEPAVWIESLHKISKDDGIRAVNFATYKNQIFKSTVFLHP